MINNLAINWNVFAITNILTHIWRLIGIYLIWIALHYFASWGYAHWCTPWGVIGFVMTPFFVASPHCYAMRWCITNGAETITTMWLILGTWFVTKLVSRDEN